MIKRLERPSFSGAPLPWVNYSRLPAGRFNHGRDADLDRLGHVRSSVDSGFSGGRMPAKTECQRNCQQNGASRREYRTKAVFRDGILHESTSNQRRIPALG